MKKNLFKKWVWVLGAILLLANTILPGMVAYAIDPEPNSELVLSCSDDAAIACINWVWYDSFNAAMEASKDWDEIRILNDLSWEIRINKSIVLDLGSNTLNWRIIVDGKTVTIKNGTINDTNNVAIRARNWANLTLENSLNVSAQEMAVMAFYGSTIIIQWWTYEAKDNCVIWTNGTYKSSDDQWWNHIIINGWEFNGYIQTPGYAACGIYAPNHDKFEINGWTYNVVWWAWIVIRAGDVTIWKDAIFNITWEYPWEGKAWDSGIIYPSKTKVVVDLAAKYPWLQAELYPFNVVVNQNSEDVFQNYIFIIDDNNDKANIRFNNNDDVELNITRNNYVAKLVKPVNPAIEWRIFGKWTNWESTEDIFWDNDSISVTSSETNVLLLKQNWNVKVDFDLSDGNIPSQTINYNTVAIEPTWLTKDKYVLDWWYTDSEYTNKFDFSTPVESNMTLYAKWKPVLQDEVEKLNEDDNQKVVITTEIEVVSVGSWDNKITNENVVASALSIQTEQGVTQVADTTTEDNNDKTVKSNELITDSNKEATVKWGLEVYVQSWAVKYTWSTAIFNKPIALRIPISGMSNWSKVKVKVKHHWESFWHKWLTLKADDSCTDWSATNEYNGTDVEVQNWHAIIYTCSASTFVAYTEANKVIPSSSSGRSSWWTKKDDKKDDTQVIELK